MKIGKNTQRQKIINGLNVLTSYRLNVFNNNKRPKDRKV